MAVHPSTGFDLEEIDRLMTTTKQVRKRLDLSRPVPVRRTARSASRSPVMRRWAAISNATAG